MKIFNWVVFSSFKKIVHCSNAAYIYVFLTLIIIPFQVFAVDEKPESLNFGGDFKYISFQDYLHSGSVVNPGELHFSYLLGNNAYEGQGRIFTHDSVLHLDIKNEGGGGSNNSPDGGKNSGKINILHDDSSPAGIMVGGTVGLIVGFIIIALGWPFKLACWIMDAQRRREHTRKFYSSNGKISGAAND